MAVDRQVLETWWSSLSDEQREQLRAAKLAMPMAPDVEALVNTVPGLPRVSGSFGGQAFRGPIPEPVRSFLREKRN